MAQKKKRKPGVKEAGTLAVSTKLQKELLLKLEQDLYEKEQAKKRAAPKKVKPTKSTKASVKKQGKELFDKPVKKKPTPKKAAPKKATKLTKAQKAHISNITKPKPRKPTPKKAATKPKLTKAQKAYFDSYTERGSAHPKTTALEERVRLETEGDVTKRRPKKKAPAKKKAAPKKKSTALVKTKPSTRIKVSKGQRKIVGATAKSPYADAPAKRQVRKPKVTKGRSLLKDLDKGKSLITKEAMRELKRQGRKKVAKRVLKELARFTPLGGAVTAAEVASIIGDKLKKRHKKNIASGKTQKPALRKIREARAAAKKTAARKKKIKPGGETVKRTRTKTYIKTKPTVIRSKKAEEADKKKVRAAAKRKKAAAKHKKVVREVKKIIRKAAPSATSQKAKASRAKKRQLMQLIDVAGEGAKLSRIIRESGILETKPRKKKKKK